MTDEQSDGKFLYSIRYAVVEEPKCVWEVDLPRKNLEFIAGLDYEYFEYIAKTIRPDLESEHKQRAAMTLRTAYHHGLETFLSLLYGALQAGDCLAGWLNSYRQDQLEDLVKRTLSRRSFPSKLPLSEVSYPGIAKALLLFSLEDKEKEKQIKEGYGRLWTRFANDYVDDEQREEFNGLKHGLRLKPGGFRLAFGTEEKYGVSPPPEQMQSMGGSAFGSTYIRLDRIGTAPKNHRRMAIYHRNWVPENYLAGLQLLSWSIQNVIAFLQRVLKKQDEGANFIWPQSQETFNEPWRLSPGVTSVHWNETIHLSDITVLKDEEIMEVYRFQQPNDSGQNSGQ